MAIITLYKKNDKKEEEVQNIFDIIVEEESINYTKAARTNSSYDNVFINDVTEDYLSILISGKIYNVDDFGTFITLWELIKASNILSFPQKRVKYESGNTVIDNMYFIESDISINASTRHCFDVVMKGIFKYGENTIIQNNENFYDVRQISNFDDTRCHIAVGASYDLPGEIQDLSVKSRERIYINYFNESITTFGSYPSEINLNIISREYQYSYKPDINNLLYSVADATLYVFNEYYRIKIRNISNKKSSNQVDYYVYNINGVINV